MKLSKSSVRQWFSLVLLSLVLSRFGHAQDSAEPRTGHFSFGEGDFGQRAFVIPLDFQKGVQLSKNTISPWIEGNSYESYPWIFKCLRPSFHPLRVLNNSATYGDICENPIALFGSQSGANPLYVGSSYRFIFYAGVQTAATDLLNELSILVYRRSDFVQGVALPQPIYEHGIDIPHRPVATSGGDAGAWNGYSDSGFTKTFMTVIDGVPILETTVQLMAPSNLPDLWKSEDWTKQHMLPLVLTHRALEGAENFYFSVGALGQAYVGGQWIWMAKTGSDGSSPPTFTNGYALNFDVSPPWISTLVKTPNFEGVPSPSVYYGKTVDEIEEARPRFELQFPAPETGQYRGVNSFPELQPHSILDSFAAKFAGNPLALVNYVRNEIALTDALSYNEDGETDSSTVNSGGINRGAWATFQEERGSPDEQCALLVYLLRRTGVPALYVRPSSGAVKMRDQDLSKLLRMRVADLTAPDGTAPVPELIGVNYPWVAAYISEAGKPSRWVHLFPWLKETEIREGLAIESYLPEEAKSTSKWLRNYLLADQESHLWALDEKDRTPLHIFELDLQRNLDENWPGLSVDNLGVQFRDRRMNYTKWDDLPQPSMIDIENGTFTTSEGVGEESAFDTFDLEISSNNGATMSVSGLRTMDFHNRRVIVNFVPGTSDNYTLTLVAEPYDPSPDRPGSDGDFTYANDFGLNRRQVRSLAVTSGDTDFTATITYHRFRSYPGADPADGNENGGWKHFLGIVRREFGSGSLPTSETSTATFKLGDLSALCLCSGAVSKKMLLTHLEPLWRHEGRRAAPYYEVPDYDLIQGTTAYLMGMSYYQRASRSIDRFKELFKLNIVSMRAFGFARFEASRNGFGKPIVTTFGTQSRIEQVLPSVDMFFSRSAWAGYGDLRPDAGGQGMVTGGEPFGLLMAELSALEHETINRYVDIEDSDTVSTVNLLHMVQQDGNPLTNAVELSAQDYISKGDVNYTKFGVTKKLKDWIGPGVWAVVNGVFQSADMDFNRVYVTPGPFAGASGRWIGVGTFVLSRARYAAYIEQSNGGAGRSMFSSSYATDSYSFNSVTVSFNDADTLSMGRNDGYVSITSTGGFNSIPNPARGSVATFNSLSVMSPTNLTFTGADSNDSFEDINVAWDRFNRSGGLVGINSSLGNWGGVHWSAGADIHFGDPVNAITGELYIDEIDLSLPGPIPLQVRRNYGSQSQASGNFGVGWKMAYFPFMVPLDTSDEKFAVAEMDGSIINYCFDPETGEYIVRPGENPHLTNGVNLAIGSVNNLFRNRISVSGDFATLEGADGSKRVFQRVWVEPGYVGPIYTGPGGAGGRPFKLVKWENSNGNYLKFRYYEGSGFLNYSPDYSIPESAGSHRSGLLARVDSSNGNFITFDYNGNGHITEVLTGDGRRVTYSYNDEGDLTEVIRPDKSWVRYEYLFEKAKVGTSTVEDWYSTHLIKREVHPGGRAVKSYYETYAAGDVDDAGVVIASNSPKVGKASHRRRVVMQEATIGKHSGAGNKNEVAAESYEPVRSGTYTYVNSKDESTGFISGRTEILDAYNRKTIYYYTNNRLTRVMDPLSTVTDLNTGEGANPKLLQRWWTAADVASEVPGAYTGALRSMQERGGAESEFYYTVDGDLSEVRVIGDFDGDGANDTLVTTAEYNDLHLPEVITHPHSETGAATGKQTRYIYEDASHPYQATSVNLLDSDGSPLLSTSYDYYDVGGTAAPFSRGLLRESRVAAGTADQAVTAWEHDLRGYPTKRTVYSGRSDQDNYPDQVTELEYNLRGETVVERMMGGGVAKRSNRYAYDDMGRPIWVERLDEDGRQVGWDYTYYNLTGEVEWKDGSRNDPEDYSYMRYDGGGRPVEQVSWRTRAKADGTGVEAVPGAEGYATTKFFYNLFGDVIKTMDPRGNTVRAWYDDIGRAIASEAYEGDWENEGLLLARETTSYDDLQRRVTKTDARGGVTDSYFTASGKPRRVINPDGTELEWRYFLDGRVRREPLGHYVYAEYEYDDGNRIITKRIKNLDGQTLGSERTELDRRGNVLRSTDLAGHSVTATYDQLNRVVSTSIAASSASAKQGATFHYDATGARQKVINLLGESTETLLDALGRTKSVVTRNSSGAVVSQSSMDYSTDHHGVTSISGSGPGAVVSQSWTDLAGRPLLQRNAGGSFTRVDYDAAGNAVAAIDELGRITRSTYDGLNRLKTTRLPDGATTQFTYVYPAGGGERIERSMPGSLVEVATTDPAGRPTGSHLLGVGGAQTRTQQGFVYYPGGKEKGMLAQFTDPRGLVHSFTYDDWLRPATSTIGDPGLDAYVSREVLGYDVRGMVTRLRETTAGGVSEVVRTYDGQSHLASEQVLIGGAAESLETVSHLVNRYDGAGRRILLGKDDSVAPLGSGNGGSWAFGHRADGRLSSVGSGGGVFQYGYGDNGLLDSRSNPFRQYSVPTSGGRDNRGRLRATNTRLSGQNADLLGEAITAISENSLQLTYSATRRVDPNSESDFSTWTDTRGYGYNFARLNLVSETWTSGPQGGQKVQLNEQDLGASGGLGVRTWSQVDDAFPGAGNQNWGVVNPGDQDAFSRIERELSGHEHLPLLAYGTARGAGKVQISLNESQTLHGTFFPAATRATTGDWDHPIKLPTGSFTMNGRADHPSGLYHADAEVQFQVGLGHFYIDSTYDNSGNVETRTFLEGNAQVWRTQVLTWDGSGRLIKLNQQDTYGAGFLWTARYDGLNRRIETTTVATRGGQPVVEAAVRERSWYDPHVEFLEVALEVKRGAGESERWWLVHGPDLSGGYGGLQGMGGLEAVINEGTGEAFGIIDDLYGHVLGFARAVSIRAAANGEIVYEAHSARFTGYGAISGTWSSSVAETTEAWRSFGWRGKRIDPSGFYHLGARYYEPNSGRFLSADPLGHAASMGLYAYANGDPINLVDPWGRSAVRPGVGAVTSSGFGGIWSTGLIRSTYQSEYLFLTIPKDREQFEQVSRDQITLQEQHLQMLGSFEREMQQWNALTLGERLRETLYRDGVPTDPGYSDRVNTLHYVSLMLSEFENRKQSDGNIYNLEPLAVLNRETFQNYSTEADFGPMDLIPIGGAASIYRNTFARGFASTLDNVATKTLPELRISAGRYPELAENIAHAQRAGHPSVLTHGGNSAANRAAALDGVPNIRPLSRDEYPFASSLEGGAGSWIGHVPVSQQNAQGAILKNFFKKNNIQSGDQYRVIIDP